jgi:RimJ/RimL family protein N-acetyltransferase
MGNNQAALLLPTPALSVDELALRAWDRSDVDIVLAAGTDTLISRYRYSLPRTAADAKKWIARTRAEHEAGTRLELAIVENGAPFGSVSLFDIGHGNAMMGYWLLPEGQGRGLATRAVRLLADWAFSALGLSRLAAFVEVDNASSSAVLERCGFAREGLLRRHLTNREGARVDSVLYGLLPEDLARTR